MAKGGAKPTLKAIEGGLSGIPPLPSTVHSSMAEEWDVIAADLRDRKLLAKPMLGVLETYVVALWMARLSAEDIATNGLTVQTAHKDKKANPATAVLKAAQVSVARLAAELGITPASRSRAGMGGDKPATPDTDPLGLD